MVLYGMVWHGIYVRMYVHACIRLHICLHSCMYGMLCYVILLYVMLYYVMLTMLCHRLCYVCIFMYVREGAKVIIRRGQSWRLCRCRFDSLPHRPKTLIVTLGDVLEYGNAKNCIHLAWSVWHRVWGGWVFTKPNKTQLLSGSKTCADVQALDNCNTMPLSCKAQSSIRLLLCPMP